MSLDQHPRPRFTYDFVPVRETRNFTGILQQEAFSKDGKLKELLDELNDALYPEAVLEFLLVNAEYNDGPGLTLVGYEPGVSPGDEEIHIMHRVYFCEEFTPGVVSSVLLESQFPEEIAHLELDTTKDVAAFTVLYEAYDNEQKISQANSN